MESRVPPSYARLRRLVEALDAPVVQLWGWPGTGKRGFLERLLEEEGVAFLTPSALEPGGGLSRRLEGLRRQGASWFVAERPAAAEAIAVADRLVPGERLLFATETRLAIGDGGHVTPPSAWMLRGEEVAGQWLADTGVELAGRTLEALAAASGGWATVLRLWATLPELRDGVTDPADPRALAVTTTFFRSRAVAALPAFEAEDVAVPRPLEVFLTARGFRSSPPIEAVDVSLQLFGVPSVQCTAPGGETQQVSWPYRRPLLLLAFLATRSNYQAPREEMIGAVWPEASEDTIRRNLHPTVSGLRRSLRLAARDERRLVRLEAGVYVLDPEVRWQTDTQEFLRLCEEGQTRLEGGDVEEAARCWRKAWRLYRGPFMQGHEDVWIQSMRADLLRRYLRLLRSLGELHLELGEFDAAEDALRGFLLEDPLEEAVYVSMMRAYAGRGRRDLVNRQYQRLRSVLITELGVEPSAETLTVYNELMV